MRTRITSLFAALILTAAAHASVLATFDNESLSASDPTQLGRLTRDSIISDWSGQKLFPGVFNPTTSYHYRTYTVPVMYSPYVQITVDDPGAYIFASAYLDTYDPNDKALNYLGDQGFSGNYFGVNPAFFQVVVPQNHSVVVLINDPAAANGGLGQPYSLVIEGFADANFNEAPEPGTMLLTAAGLFGAALALRRRRTL
jgi:hypothetical protein